MTTVQEMKINNETFGMACIFALNCHYFDKHENSLETHGSAYYSMLTARLRPFKSQLKDKALK